MPPHVHSIDRTCRCSTAGLEPNENCPIHGGGEWPPRCGTCGRFMEPTEYDTVPLNQDSN